MNKRFDVLALGELLIHQATHYQQSRKERKGSHDYIYFRFVFFVH